MKEQLISAADIQQAAAKSSVVLESQRSVFE
jgi:hypothetical protein